MMNFYKVCTHAHVTTTKMKNRVLPKWIDFLCCVKTHHKLNSLKQDMFIIPSFCGPDVLATA